MSENYKDFIGGTVGGMAQVLAGQPFDIIKVRAAAATTPMSAMDSISQILKQEGVPAFWKGSIPPLIAVGACVSIQFGVLENMKRVLRRRGELTTSDYVLCGAFAGVCSSVISSPAENFRIRMQIQGKVDPRGDPLYKGDIDCIKTVIKNHGMKGVYKGFGITVIREALTFGSYFGTYEYIVNNILMPPSGKKSDIPIWKLFLTGGFCGYVYWGPWYPIDAIKSKIQADSLANPRYSGVLDCISKTLKAEGLAGVYKGFAPCMLRAFPANGVTFLSFELTMRLISSPK